MTENDHIANLSRLMDEDLDYQADQGECGELIDALCENPRLRGKLCRYQLLRDFMRNRLPAHPAPTHFSAMVMQEINAKRAVGKT
ncbi:MAG: RseA family anti-sigma factor, partial [Candidatus Eutrophobiaceae bacterium]